MKVVLFQPQIPQNTGNIARTCAVTGASLILVAPLGFSISDRMMKRAGLDYWDGLNKEVIHDLEAYLENCDDTFYFFSSKATNLYTDVNYDKNSHLIFGSETDGLPEVFWERWPERFVTLPMAKNQRCLNLASSAAVSLYEAWRQLGFKDGF